MHRFIVLPEVLTASVVSLGPADSHHAAVVLRVAVGEKVTLLDGQGTIAQGTVVSVSKRDVQVSVTSRDRARPRRGDIVLAVALTKAKAWDSLLQKATELDVAGIVPLLTRHCVVKVDPSERGKRRDDWQMAVAEATKQCGTPWMPQVELPRTLAEWLGEPRPRGLALVAALAPGTCEIGEALEAHPEAQRVTIVIGPEGDFDAAELRSLLGAGCIPVTLGPTILRADTAAVTAAAVVAHGLRRRIVQDPGRT
jgi:16S rRNA (uracil1498-N3)-methyltransferase